MESGSKLNKIYLIPYVAVAFVIGVTLSVAYAIDTHTCTSPGCVITFDFQAANSTGYPSWVDAFTSDGYNTIYLKPNSQYKYFSLGDSTPASEFVNDCNRFAASADCGIEIVSKEGSASVLYFSRGTVPGKQLMYSILQNTDGSITLTKQGDYDNTADRTDIQIMRSGLIYVYSPVYIKDSAGVFCKITSTPSGAMTCQH